ncbi:MAG: hypothetical protein JSV03_00090, partial [Planctomycetota bacterium]
MRCFIETCLVSMVLILSMRAATAVCTITGKETIEYNSRTYRAVHDGCVYYVDLAMCEAKHRGIPLPDLKKTTADNYAPDAVPDPVILELTDYVDCTKTDHNFQEDNIWPTAKFPNLPSRLMTISGKQFRVTAAPNDGFATYYYSYDARTAGTAGMPHLIVAELSNDQERYTSLQIHHPDATVISPDLPWAPPYADEPTYNPWGDPWWKENTPRIQQGPAFGPDVGLAVYTGRELPINKKPFNISMLFYPKTTSVRVVVSSLGCNLNRTESDGGAVSQIWVFKFVDKISDTFPAHNLPEKASQQRHIGIHTIHPWYFYAHYGTPCRKLRHRKEGLRRVVRHFKWCGFNIIVFNAINGSDRCDKTWYKGGAHFDWNSAGDLLAELPPIAEKEGVQLVPLVTSLKRPAHDNGLSYTTDSYQMDSKEGCAGEFDDEVPDPLRPEVQQLMFNLLEEIAHRCASSPAVRGIGMRVNGKIGTCYTSSRDGRCGARHVGYSAWNLQQFKNDTRSEVPTSPPASAYRWLVDRPDEWEAWLNWRCARTREFWLACRDVIKAYRADLVFFVQCDLPSETPGTNIEWPTESARDLLRHHGYDPDMFAQDSGIIITRGMMVAQDRFYSRTRWRPPWGTNHENYRLFHYAPGLAELYHTAEGRACDFYQTYWEEAGNPYFEFGSPGDPDGFFRTNTPAAPGRAFFRAAVMSIRRQDPDMMTWLGWNRPTLGHESELRKFAQAFRALPTEAPVKFNGEIDPKRDEVVVRWYGNRLAVINDTDIAQTITLHFDKVLSSGCKLINVITGQKFITAG